MHDCLWQVCCVVSIWWSTDVYFIYFGQIHTNKLLLFATLTHGHLNYSF